MECLLAMMNLKFKRIMSMLLAFALIFTFAVPAFATSGNDVDNLFDKNLADNEMTRVSHPGGEVLADISQDNGLFNRAEMLGGGAPLFDPGCPYFDPEMIDQLVLERSIAEGRVMARSIPVMSCLLHRYSLRQQETRWWCGPASAQMALEAHRGQVVSQRTFAQEFGNVNSGGTYIHDMRRSLSDRRVHYVHMRADQINVQTFERRMVEAIHNFTLIPILQSCVSAIPWIQSSNRGGHYIVVGRYSNFRGNGNATLAISDPHWDNRFFGTWHNIPVNQAQNSVNRHNGHFLA